jgi:hypothetical protein
VVTLADAKRCGFEKKVRDEVLALTGAVDSRQAGILWIALEQGLVGLEVLKILGVLKFKRMLQGDPKVFYSRMTKIADKVEKQAQSQGLDPQRVQAEIEGETLLPLQGLGG